MKTIFFLKIHKSKTRRILDIITACLVGISAFLFGRIPIPDNFPYSRNVWIWSGAGILIIFWICISLFVIPSIVKKFESKKK